MAAIGDRPRPQCGPGARLTRMELAQLAPRVTRLANDHLTQVPIVDSRNRTEALL